MTKQYPSQARLREAFDYHPDGYLVWRIKPRKGPIRAGDRAGSRQSAGYTQLTFEQVNYFAHRLVWIWHYGDIHPNLEVDHVNADKADNRIENLQLLTPTQNSAKHVAANKVSGLPLYVRENHGRYQARYKGQSLGNYATPDEAAEAVSRAVADIAVAERQHLAHHLEMTEGAGARL